MRVNDGASRSGLRGVVVYVPAALLAQFKAAKNLAGVTYSEWLLDHLDQLWEQLDGAFARPKQRSSPLPARGPARRRELEAPQALQLRLTQEEIDAVDHRAAEVGAGSRSAFVTRLVELSLDPARQHALSPR